MRNKNRAKRHIARMRRIEARTVEIIAPDGTAIEVDAFMKPVLLRLWSRGIKTLNSCAGHFPDYKAYIHIERNADFEECAGHSPWEHETCPIVEINPLFNAKVIKTEIINGKKHCYYSKSDKEMVIDTGRTALIVRANTREYGPSKRLRGLFLRWLLDY